MGVRSRRGLAFVSSRQRGHDLLLEVARQDGQAESVSFSAARAPRHVTPPSGFCNAGCGVMERAMSPHNAELSSEGSSCLLLGRSLLDRRRQLLERLENGCPLSAGNRPEQLRKPGFAGRVDLRR